MSSIPRDVRLFGTVVFAVTFLVLLPGLFLFPGRDAAVFLYIGQGILLGEVPYRDAWDHKAPLIHFINALGLAIAGGKLWGVWLLRFLSLFLSGWLSYVLLRARFSGIVAAGGTLLWMATFPSLLRYGNLTEEYNLPLQFAAILLAIRKVAPGRWFFWVGVLAGLAFMLRQNNIGTFVAVVVASLLFSTGPRLMTRALAPIGWALLGAITVLVPMAAYFLVNGAWGDMWDAAFGYSLAYSATTTAQRLKSIGAGLDLFHWSWAALLVWATVAVRHLALRRRSDGAAGLLESILLIGIPLEILLAAISGRTYPHYYLVWLPLMAVAISALFHHLLERKRRLWTGMAIILAAGAFVDVDYRDLRRGYREMDDPTKYEYVRESVDWLEEHTSPDDLVLVYGADAVSLVMTGRRSPSRFFWTPPLVTEGFMSATLIEEFVSDVRARPPAAILDTNHDALPPLNARDRIDWVLPERARKRNFSAAPAEFDGFFGLVDEEYELMDSAKDYWHLYLPRTPVEAGE